MAAGGGFHVVGVCGVIVAEVVADGEAESRVDEAEFFEAEGESLGGDAESRL